MAFVTYLYDNDQTNFLLLYAKVGKLPNRSPFCFLDLRGGNSYHSSFDDPLGKGAAHEADVTTR